MIAKQVVRGNVAMDASAPGEASLLEVARSSLGVKSASRGCHDGSCGACRVILDGALVKACAVRWDEVEDRAVLLAYEDVRRDSAAKTALSAFEDERPTRCKLCVGALGVTAVWLARSGRAGRPAAVEDALADVTCACTGRGSLRRALLAR